MSGAQVTIESAEAGLDTLPVVWTSQIAPCQCAWTKVDALRCFRGHEHTTVKPALIGFWSLMGLVITGVLNRQTC